MSTDRITLFARRMERIRPSAIRELLRLGADPSIISFGGGYPDASLFPISPLNKVFQTALLAHGKTSLQYTVSNGIPRLREQVAQRMQQDGTDCTADDILILQGGQQGLDLVAKMLINPGDVIITERPTFLGALIAFNPYEPRYIDVSMDRDGMNMDELQEILESTRGVKFVYTVPDFQNPTGVTLSLARRRQLVELANRFNFIVLEDSPYRELRHQGESIPTLKSLDTQGRVIHLGSFSKILAPGLRLGWAVAARDFIHQLGLLKLAADTQCSTLNMYAVSTYLDTYDINEHILAIRKTYRAKKHLLLETIRKTFPPCISFTEPDGGMFTWLTFPREFDTARFMQEQALPKAKVAYVPGASFFSVHEEPNHARVSFSTQSDEAIVQGMTSLGQLLTATFAE